MVFTSCRLSFSTDSGTGTGSKIRRAGNSWQLIFYGIKFVTSVSPMSRTQNGRRLHVVILKIHTLEWLDVCTTGLNVGRLLAAVWDKFDATYKQRVQVSGTANQRQVGSWWEGAISNAPAVPGLPLPRNAECSGDFSTKRKFLLWGFTYKKLIPGREPVTAGLHMGEILSKVPQDKG